MLWFLSMTPVSYPGTGWRTACPVPVLDFEGVTDVGLRVRAEREIHLLDQLVLVLR